MGSYQECNTDFFVQIQDGNSFKNLMGAVKSEKKGNICMILVKEGIRITFNNKPDDVTYSHNILLTRFTEYRFTPRLDNGTRPDMIKLGFPSKEMSNALKIIGKKDSVQLYRLYDDNDEPKIIIRTVNSQGYVIEGGMSVTITGCPDTLIPKINIDGLIPNASVPTKVFNSKCTSMSNTGCEYLQIRGYSSGVVFAGRHPSDKYTFVYPYGLGVLGLNFIEAINKRDDMVILVDVVKKTAKSLSKFSIISEPSRNLDFFFAMDAMVIRSGISTMGEYIVLITQEEN